MSKKIESRLREHFQGWAERLTSDLRSSRALDHAGDIGEKNEGAVMAFIEAHLPLRCRVTRGGYIFGVAQENYDSPGELVASKQIDLIVTNDLTMQFGEPWKSFNSIEGCYSAISVKTDLDKTQLYDALNNIASIPELQPWHVQFGASLSGVNKTLFFDLPFTCIFAYEGATVGTTMRNVEDFYQDNQQISGNRRPNIIVVNNKYLLHRIDPWQIECEADMPKSGYLLYEGKRIGGQSLFALMRGIQGAANYAAHVTFGFSHYSRRINWDE